MCRRNWIEETINNAYGFLEKGNVDAVSEIISVLSENKQDEGDSYRYIIDGRHKSSICKADYFFAIGSLLSAFPDKENEALEAFCMYNYYQIQKKKGARIKGTNSYYSFRKANEYSYADLASNTITLVSPKLMNDPLDTLMFPWLKAREQNCERMLQQGDFSDEFKKIARRTGRLFIKAHDFYKIRSFCIWEKGAKEPPFQNTLMWSHYADSHKGFCVVYKLSPEMRFNKENSAYYTLSPMNYHRKPIDLIKETEFDGKAALLTKSKAWEYENEYRLLMYDPSKKEDYFSMSLDPGSYVDAIIFGMKCSDSTRNIIRSILKGREVKYYEMREDLSNIYSLKIYRLTSDDQVDING